MSSFIPTITMRKLILLHLLFISILSCSVGDEPIDLPVMQEEIPDLNIEYDCECNITFDPSEPTMDDKVFSGDINLRTQAQVDAFGAENYTIIDGSLHVGELRLHNGSPTPTNISTLLPLSSLRQVNKGIIINVNPLLIHC